MTSPQESASIFGTPTVELDSLGPEASCCWDVVLEGIGGGGAVSKS